MNFPGIGLLEPLLDGGDEGLLFGEVAFDGLIGQE